MKKYIVFNFKNNPSTTSELNDLIKTYNSSVSVLKRKYQLILIPSVLHLLLAQDKLKTKFLYGIQNIFWLDKIAITGEITPKMAVRAGVKFVLIGHSERKKYLNEDWPTINQKIKASLSHNLIPIICVGEKQKIDDDKVSFALKQEIFEDLNYSFRGIKLNARDKLIIAYEPQWAIGSGLTPTNQIIKEVGKLIRFWLCRRFSEAKGSTIPILYGGSIERNNILEILSLKEINGIFIGSASSNNQKLKQIINKLIKN
ncbi:MAG: triosephosphate isomerase [Parcubacteria group bacterium]|nr:triosephosphate isomerase [Parcubacteria group bacterium]